jgi:hypothetical protein
MKSVFRSLRLAIVLSTCLCARALAFQVNDNCFNAQSVFGAGPFSFDTTFATNTSEGQSNSLCNIAGTSNIERDVWFIWTASSTGSATLATCGMTSIDSKVAVYDQVSCPPPPAIACNDDVCALQSRLCFLTNAGQNYLIQIGVYPGSTGGPGQFTLTQGAASPTHVGRYDDGSSENVIGLINGGSFAWLHRFGQIGQTVTVRAISTAYGTPLFPGLTPPDGAPADVALWDDPNDDGDPSDAVLLVRVSTTIQHTDTDILNRVALPPTSVNGIYFVGAVVTHAAGQYVGSFDQNSCPSGSLGRAWYAGSSTPVFNFLNLAANTFPPIELDVSNLPGVFLLRVDQGQIDPGSDCLRTPPGTTYKDYSATPIPNNFFGSNSMPFTGRIDYLGGSTNGSGLPAGTDTIVKRTGTVDLSGGCGSNGSVPIEIVSLSLVSASPITVNFQGGGSSTYNVGVALSSNAAQSTGSMLVNLTTPNGGTFDSTLPVRPRMVFTRVGGTLGVTSAVLDPAPVVTLTGTGTHWSYTDEGFGISGSTGGFVDHDGNGATPQLPFPGTSGFYVGIWRPNANCSGGGDPPQQHESYEKQLLAQHGLYHAGSSAPGGGTYGFGFGDSQYVPCPCGNTPLPGTGQGCTSSLGVGARLSIAGNASVSSDTLVLLGSNMPNSSALYFQGSSQQSGGAGIVFGDGKRLAAGAVIRLGTKFNAAGSSQYPAPGDTLISVRGMIPPGGGVTREYQIWYRNAAAFCTASTFNLSGAYQILWGA